MRAVLLPDCYLLEHADRIVSREELAAQFWPDEGANETTILHTIRSLWIAVGDNSRNPVLIKPLSNHGYRIAVPVTVIGKDAGEVKEVTPEGGPDEAIRTMPEGAIIALPILTTPMDIRLRDVTVRRQLTVLFCDLIISSMQVTAVDPEDHVEAIQACLEACATVIAQYEGHVAQQSLGGGFWACFGYPQAHEDNAPRAVYSALDIVEAITLLNPPLQLRHGVSVTVQIGIHTRVTIATTQSASSQEDILSIGEVPMIAMRLQEELAPNTIGISAATYHLVHRYFVCQTLGDRTLRSLPGSTQLYQVLRKHHVQSRFGATLTTRALMPIVGRESELRFLLGQWYQARESLGSGVCLSGEAGMGKSRLVQAFKDQLGADAYTLLECQSSPYDQRTAFWPLLGLFDQLCEWEPHEQPNMKVKKLETMLSQLTLPRAETLALLANLLSLTARDGDESLRQMNPQERQLRTIRAFLTILLALADQKPLLLVIEDVQWADTSTLNLLDLLIEQVASARILVLLIFRSDYHLSLRTRLSMTHLTLGALMNHQTEQMILQMTHGKTLPVAVLRQLVAKTDGLPLFVEEMVRMVMDSGLMREHDDRYELDADLPVLTIPTTLHDLLIARLDQLEGGQETAKLLATIGRAFSYDLIRAVVTGKTSTLQQDLTELVKADLLHQHGLPPQAHYRFKHALIQEIAYQSLPRHTRRQYHERVAHVLEQAFPETCATHPERLAHHYTEAGLSQKSVVYWQQAAQQALDRIALSDAAAHAQQGLFALSTLPENEARRQHELHFQILLCKACDKSSELGRLERKRAYRRAYELCEQIGNVSQRFDVLGGLRIWYLERAELSTAHDLGEQLLELAQREADPTLLRKAHRDVATTLFFLGAPTDAMQHIEQALPDDLESTQLTLTPQHLQIAETALLRYQAWTQWLLGYPERAFEPIAQALQLSQSNVMSLGLDLLFKLILHQWRGEPEAIERQVDTVIDLAQSYQYPSLLARAHILKGWSLAQQGDQEAGIDLIQRYIADYRARGSELFLTYFMALLAESYGQAGDIEIGLDIISEAITLVDQTGERCWEAELYRLQAELLLRQVSPDVVKAEAALQQALSVACQQKARMLELRAATSLSHLWHQQGKRQPAFDLLQAIYRRFTEGHETLDLKNARACLDALA